MSKITSARKPGVRKKKQKINSGTTAILQRAHRFHREGKLREAIQAYEQFLDKVPEHAETLGNLGLLRHSQGKPKQAVQLYQQALALDPQLWHLYYFLGNGFREQNQYKQAAEAYQQSLVGGADKTATLLQLGKTYIAAEQPEKGQKCFEKILALHPDDDQAAYQLGLLFFQQEQYEQAVLHFLSVLSAQPDNVDVCFNLALCHKALDHTDQALNFMRRANRIAPYDGEILYNIGVLYKNQRELDKAEDFFLQALKINPEHGICLTDLAILYHIQNRLNKARVTYQKALDIGYHVDSASHMLAALKGETTATTPLGHVRDLFNNFAENFDHSLVNDLKYTIPTQLSLLFQKHHSGTIIGTTVDLGCGTGLSGLAFRPLTQHLTGVDLAENMLTIAQGKNLYDELYCTDIIGFLHGRKQQYDLALAADVCVYIGELESFFQAVAQSLTAKGLFLFSVETCSEDYNLRQSGRYAHSPEYIAKLADTFCYSIECCQTTGIRKERGQWIPGKNYLLSFKK